MVSSIEAYRTICSLLKEAGIEDAGFETELLLRHVVGAGRFDVEFIAAEQWQTLQALAKRRAERYPLQYLFGCWPFMELELLVGPGVLIPRPETELVCEAAIECIKEAREPKVLDLCAGSGALGLGVAQALPNAQVTAVEFSEKALVWLQKNVEGYAEKYKNPPEVVWADVFAYCEEVLPESFDLIMSNPPYVSESEYAKLAPELHFEPKEALVASEEGLAFYKFIAQHYGPALKKGGRLVFELGAGQGEEVRTLLAQNRYKNLQTQLDFAGHERVIMATYQ